jgi:hypothetical protein
MSSEIGSREQLMVDLTLALAPGSRERLLSVVRLHGLQALAERAGPAARDELVGHAQRVALREVRACGRFYLPRRDELCVLFDSPLDEAIRVLDTVTTALNELDPMGDVTAEAGVALLPDEASHPIGALDRADRRSVRGAAGARSTGMSRPSRTPSSRSRNGSFTSRGSPHSTPGRWCQTSRRASACAGEGRQGVCMSSPAPPYALSCIECGTESVGAPSAHGWRGYRCDDPDLDEAPALAFYCPLCAVAEFGPARSSRRA